MEGVPTDGKAGFNAHVDVVEVINDERLDDSVSLVELVADERVADVGEVDADLMVPAGDGPGDDEGVVLEAFDDLVVRL